MKGETYRYQGEDRCTTESTIESKKRLSSKRKPPAVDLSIEQTHIQEHGMAYLHLFLENMKAFAKETDTRAQTFSFEHRINRAPDGRVTLFYVSKDPSTQTEVKYIARVQYLQAAEDESLSDWDRERHEREYHAICEMERMLETAQPGTTFVEGSPAPFEQSEEDLEGTYYGAFSFFRFHTLEKDQYGHEILKGHALKHYLDAETQTELFSTLTRETDVDPQSLLGTVRTLSPSQGFEHVSSIENVAQVIESIGDEYKTGKEEAPRKRSDEEIDAFLQKTEPILMDIFRLLHRDTPQDRQLVLQKIRQWRNLTRDYCDGDDKALELVEMYRNRKTRAVAAKTITLGYSLAPISLGYNSCGTAEAAFTESLFGQGISVIQTGSLPSHKMLARLSYQMETLRAASESDVYYVNCPSTASHSQFPNGKSVLFNRRAVLQKKTLVCPCGACAEGCDVEAIVSKAKKAPPHMIRRARSSLPHAA